MPVKPNSVNSLLPPRPRGLFSYIRRNTKTTNYSATSSSSQNEKTTEGKEESTYKRYSVGIDSDSLPQPSGLKLDRKQVSNSETILKNGGTFSVSAGCSSSSKAKAKEWNKGKSRSDGHLERIKPVDGNWVFGKPKKLEKSMTTLRTESVTNPAGYFRSSSLRNLLKSEEIDNEEKYTMFGGMNKSRNGGGPTQVKKVLPPVAPPLLPGLVTFASFRVKKGQSLPSTPLTPDLEENKQRYSTSSSESDNSLHNDPYIIPSSRLKDLEEDIIYGDCDEGYVDSRKGLKTSVSFDSFTAQEKSLTEMHQNHYGKIERGPPLGNGLGKEGGHYALGQSSNLPSGPPNIYQSPHPGLTSQYQTQISMEDQGIDMTQSPGRESPSSTASSTGGSGSGSGIGSVSSGSGGSNNGCRNSTSSFDSGRASGSTIYQQGVRYSGLSSESSSGSFRHSYHSSNSSLGSIPPPPEDICNFDVSAMISQGIPDHEVLNAWLTGVHFECYYQNFIQAGYDIHTISRMTPEDLNAIGVTKPHHRKRLKAEISQLTISDGLLDYIPSSIEEWLGQLRLDEYTNKLKAQGYHDVRQVTNITWEDLEDIGILKLGHQKKFMLAIKRVEDILAGKRVHQPIPPPVQSIYSHPTQDMTSRQPLPYSHPLHHQLQQQQMLLNASGGGTGLVPNVTSYQFLSRGGGGGPLVPSSHLGRQPIYGQVLTHHPQIHQEQIEEQREYHPEVISIHVKHGARRRSLENVTHDEPIYGTSSFLPQPHVQENWTRSSAKGTYEIQDGDRTPTNESQGFHTTSTTSTLPRLLKNKPIAKIMAGGDRSSMAQPAATTDYVGNYGSGISGSDGFKSLPRDIGRKNSLSERIDIGGLTYVTGGYGHSGGMYDHTFAHSNLVQFGTKNPPPPPRRGSGESIYGPLSTFQQGTGYMGWTTQFPPPPPTLSCDVPYGTPPGMSMDDLPLPPHPEDILQMNQSQGLTLGHSSTTASNGTSTPSSSSSSPNNPVKMVTTTSVVHYLPHMRTSPQNVKSRDPSPDFLDSDLPNNGLMSRGVRRNGSDASFKSNSSTESESIPFANDNAGTIKQQKASNRATAQLVVQAAAASSTSSTTSSVSGGTGDVLNDIGNMLADLTDELDAILEQEIKSKR